MIHLSPSEHPTERTMLEDGMSRLLILSLLVTGRECGVIGAAAGGAAGAAASAGIPHLLLNLLTVSSCRNV